MIKLTKHIFSLVALAIIATSCLPDPIPIHIEEAESKLVISSQVIPDENMIVSVTRSIGALDYSSNDESITGIPTDLIEKILVDNAIVTITYEGITDTLKPIFDQPGFYFSVETPQYKNNLYELYVYDPKTTDTVTSKAIMLDQVRLDNIEANKEFFDGYEKMNVTYSFTDPVDEANWYMVNIIAPNTAAQDTNMDNINSFFAGDDRFLTETIFFSDKIIENGSYTATEELYYWESDTVIVTISNISEGYFWFLHASQRNDNFIATFLNDPSTYPTNIEGGYGFFFTHYPDFKAWDIAADEEISIDDILADSVANSFTDLFRGGGFAFN